MSNARLLIGDVRDRLQDISDSSIDLGLFSPPFLALRSYLPQDHPDKHREIGSEPTPAAFLDTLLELTDEFRRVLTPYGSICVELGDTYAGSGGAGGDYGEDGLRAGQPKFRRADGDKGKPQTNGTGGPLNPGGGLVPFNAGKGWPLGKSLCHIPHLYSASLAYGRNLLNPDHRFDPWRIRNLLVWARPNPPVGALGDKFRPATSYVTVATMARDRWFDLDAVRTALTEPGAVKHKTKNHHAANPRTGWTADNADIVQNPAGAPPLDWDAPDDWDQLFQDALDDFLAAWWQPLIDLPTQPYKGSHYATFPMELPRRLIEAMCPRQVCTTCGEPRRRIVAPSERYAARPNAGRNFNVRDKGQGTQAQGGAEAIGNGLTAAEHVTLGWTDCHHNTWRNGMVLDPFAGSGTTLAAAIGVGRDATGIDIDERNAELARERCGMFLEVATS